MTLHEEQKQVQKAVRSSLSYVKEDPWLAQRVLANVKGEKPVKKLSATTILVIVLICVMATGALAATLNAWGILDFAGSYQGSYIPPDSGNSITQENLTVQTDLVTCAIRESYYDGKILRLTADISSKNDALLFTGGSGAEDPISDLSRDSDEDITIGDYAFEHCEGRLTEVDLYTPIDWSDYSLDCMMNEDRSLTLYIEAQFMEEHPDLEVPLQLTCLPMTISAEQVEDGDVSFDASEMERTDFSLTVHSVPVTMLVSTEPLDFPDEGVRVTCVTLTVTPLEIRFTLDYEVTDPDAYNATEDGLWFEFIDPESPETEAYAQRLTDGLTSGGSILRLNGNGEWDQPIKAGAAFRQTDAIGRNNLSDTYTIRAYNCWDKTRYETVTFKVTEKTE